MARCPNCGRETERTIDWACKWCGYPLQSRSFKKIDKTWRQIREERMGGVQYEDKEPEPERKQERVERVREPEPVVKPRPAPPEPQRRPPPRRAPEPEPEPEIEPEPEEVETVAETKAEPESLVSEEQAVEAEEVVETEPLIPEPGGAPEAEPVSPPPAQQRVPPQPPAPPPPQRPAQPQPGASTPSFEATVEQIRQAYKTDEAGTHEKLKNKIIRVKGIVDKVEVNEARALYKVLLTGSQKGEEFRDVECRFNKGYAGELGKLKVGETITVDGAYTGYVINVILRQCVLVG